MINRNTNPKPGIKKTAKKVRNTAAKTAKKTDDYLEKTVPSMTNTGLYKGVKAVAKKLLKPQQKSQPSGYNEVCGMKKGGGVKKTAIKRIGGIVKKTAAKAQKK